MRSSFSFVCSECGYETSQWLGKCPECDTWNSLREFQVSAKFKVQSSKLERGGTVKPRTLSEIGSSGSLEKRILTGFSEMNGVLGGGIVPGSVTLLAGDPGVGKSTLLLQIAINLANRMSHVENDARQTLPKKSNSCRSLSEDKQLTSNSGKIKFKPVFSSFSSEHTILPLTVLYISGEESEEQIKLRAKRIVESEEGLKNFFLVSTTKPETAISIIEKLKPSLVIVDSIQTMESENLEGLAGSVAQVRYSAFSFIKTAKTLNIPIILVGHVTKEGMVAGPMILSHMVDSVLFLEGEKTTGTRILRSFKNRFGPVDEIGLFEINEKGMVELTDAESLFLSKKEKEVPGSVLTVTMEGTRAFLVEIQALVIFSKLPMPKRIVSGLDRGRVELLLAVLQKHVRIPLDSMDVFVNVAGGLRLSDRACDLGICLAIFSSFKNTPLSKIVGISEVGLLGELRNVSLLEKRVKEARKLGFKRIISCKDYSNINQVTVSLAK